MKLNFEFNDGGRSKYYRATEVGDCAVRAAAIATGKDYKEVYDLFKAFEGKSPRNGVSKATSRKVLAKLGGRWIPTMKIGSGCKVHLAQNEIPMQGRIVAAVTGHLTAVIDGVINDTYDPSRDGTRCVYGYWVFN